MGIITSWSKVTRAIRPYIHEDTGSDTFLKANAIKSRMHSNTSPSATSALVRNSAPRDGNMFQGFSIVDGNSPPTESAEGKSVCVPSDKVPDSMTYPLSPISYKEASWIPIVASDSESTALL